MNRELIDRLAAAIRATKRTPDALIYIDIGDDTIDHESLLGIPVYTLPTLFDGAGYAEHSVPFIPVWVGESNARDVLAFRRGWKL